MKRSDVVAGSRGVWLAAAFLPLLLLGCQGDRTAEGNTPGERVAGERQEEPSAEVRAAMEAAGLPESFAFGGRTWRGHQIHRVEADKVAMGRTPAANPPGPAGAPDTSAAAPEGRDAFDYTPVADLKLGEHQIYRKSGVDEAFTDNIFLLASGATAAAAAGEGAGATQEQVVFIEYDADETQPAMDLAHALRATGLPESVKMGDKTLTAREVEQYDPDAFDEFKKISAIQGHTVYQGDDPDQVVLMEQISGMGMPGTAGDTSSTSPDAGTQGGMSGPIFIRYEEGATEKPAANP